MQRILLDRRLDSADRPSSRHLCQSQQLHRRQCAKQLLLSAAAGLRQLPVVARPATSGQ